jgi:hypothetical protein
MPEGYLGHFPPPAFEGQPAVGELYSNKAVDPVLFFSFLESHDVGAIVIDAETGLTLLPFINQLNGFGLHPVSVGGVLLYRIPAARR